MGLTYKKGGDKHLGFAVYHVMERERESGERERGSHTGTCLMLYNIKNTFEVHHR